MAFALENAAVSLLVCWLDNSGLELGHFFQAGNGLWMGYWVDRKAVDEVISHWNVELLLGWAGWWPPAGLVEDKALL